jgi:ubiquinone/menaquinone biosynthesis C-methylase UbiE
MNGLLKGFEKFVTRAILPQVSWLPRYYILFKWGSFKKNGSVLDIGCGEGGASLKLASLCRRVVGLDLQERHVRTAYNARAALQLKNKVSFVAGNVLSLPFLDNMFDQAIFMDALPEVKEDMAALKEIARVLKRGGTLIISVATHYACIGTLFTAQKILKKIIPRALWRPYKPGKKAWLEGDEAFIKQEINVQQNYSLEDLKQKAEPFFEILRHTYILKKYGALATDFTYGVKGMWFLRPILFWLAVRLDYYFQNKSEGYTVVVELKKKSL